MGEAKFKVPWIPLIAYGAILAALVQFLTLFVGPNTHSWVCDHSMGLYWQGTFSNSYLIAYVFLWFGVIIMPALSKKMNPQLLTLIYVVTLLATLKGGYPGNYNLMTQVIDTRVSKPALSPVLPTWWIPVRDDALPALLGGTSVPWHAWVPTFFTWMGVPIVCFIMFTSLMAILRRQWIEIEDLPYPHARIAYEIQGYILEPQNKENKTKMKVALLGFSVMFLFMLPYVIIPLFPQFPDPYGYISWHRFNFGWYDTKRYSRWLYDSIHGLRHIGLSPVYITIGYMMPLTTLNTVAFGLVFRLFTPNILVTMGYPSVWHGYDIQQRWPFGFGPLVYGGMLPGMVFFWIIANRIYLINTFKAAFGKAPMEFKEKEKEEPLSYRTAYLLFIISFLIMYGFTLALVRNPIVTLTVAGGALLWDGFLRSRIYAYAGVGGAQSWGDEGAYYWMWYYQDPVTKKPYPWLPDVGKNPSAEPGFVWAVYLSDMAYRNPNTTTWANGWGMFAGDIFRMAHLTKTDAKTVFKLAVITITIASIVTVPIIIWGWYTWGAKALPARLEGDKMKYAHLGRFSGDPMTLRPIDPTVGGFWTGVPWQIAGGVLGFLITYAQARFTWFPFDVIGFYLTWSRLGMKYGVDFMFTLAWILKLLTIKLGGTRAYERYGIPFAAGAMAGWCFHIFLHDLACTYSFFAI